MIGPLYFLIIALVWAIIIVLSIELAKYLQTVYESRNSVLDKIFDPIDNFIYYLLGIDKEKGMKWKEYFKSLFIFTIFGTIISFLVLLFQGFLPLNPMKFPDLSWSLALNTAMSIASNTNLQHYGGGSSLSYLSQMVGIQFLQFTSAA